ncbi:hypothetical protein MUK42_35820 [Musa troglodytarum]|uniref:Uncharacterized protein n=1 Tax=Musa troglodytarum TaxID=320322 RepID=A0A9E7L2D8_9LILI|nr:hypothetical protein MUK42_35820 [Musa troglodytarum]
MDGQFERVNLYLPDDCLLMIFRKLQNRADRNAFGLTCHRWLQIQNIARRSLALQFSYDPNIYRNYVIYLPRLLTRFPHLRSISLAGCTELPDSALLRLRDFGSNIRAIRGTGFAGHSSTLTYLEADSCMLTPEGLSEAVSGGGLEYLNISNLRVCIGADGLAMIGAGSATKLRYLNLRMCRLVSDDSVIAIAQGCPLLEEWSLSVCHELHGIGDIQDAEARCADKKRGINYEVATISSIPQAQKYEEEMKIQMGGVCRQGIEKAENSNASITTCHNNICIMASSSTTNLRIIVSSVNDFPLNTLRPSPDVLVLVTLLSGGAAKGFDLE